MSVNYSEPAVTFFMPSDLLRGSAQVRALAGLARQYE